MILGDPTSSHLCAPSAPFEAAYQLNHELHFDHVSHTDTLPGYPRLFLKEETKVIAFLRLQLFPVELEKMARKLWCMSKHDRASISPLHRQQVKKRKIVITGDPKLHLVWYHDRIFIKPMPKYLMSYTVWKNLLSCNAQTRKARREARQAALDFIRTYYHLLQHESDLRMAKKIGLIPERVTWERFCAFSNHSDIIEDCSVLGRYEYGEIRLTRHNFYALLLLRKRHFQRIETQYSSYFARFYGPILFAIGIASVALNAMQVDLSVEQIDKLPAWTSFQEFSRVFAVIALASISCLSIVFVSILIYKIASEWYYAVPNRRSYHCCRECLESITLERQSGEV